jgi:hypothetical protein
MMGSLFMVQHPTSNNQHPVKKPDEHQYWMFDVGCWVLDVSDFAKP